jgi:hypothetical protein
VPATPSTPPPSPTPSSPLPAAPVSHYTLCRAECRPGGTSHRNSHTMLPQVRHLTGRRFTSPATGATSSTSPTLDSCPPAPSPAPSEWPGWRPLRHILQHHHRGPLPAVTQLPARLAPGKCTRQPTLLRRPDCPHSTCGSYLTLDAVTCCSPTAHAPTGPTDPAHLTALTHHLTPTPRSLSHFRPMLHSCPERQPPSHPDGHSRLLRIQRQRQGHGLGQPSPSR